MDYSKLWTGRLETRRGRPERVFFFSGHGPTFCVPNGVLRPGVVDRLALGMKRLHEADPSEIYRPAVGGERSVSVAVCHAVVSATALGSFRM
jgi:hypothetical protein